MTKILIVTGGSGGHVIPALTIFDHLKNNFDARIATDERGTKFINKQDYEYNLIKVPNLFSNIWSLPFKLFKFIYVMFESYNYLKKNNISKIISTGGYMSFPFCFASLFLNCEIVLFEPNSVIGRSNKYMIKIAKKILCYDKNLKLFPKKYFGKIALIAPILRKKIYEAEKNSQHLQKKVIKILIVGGSQGSIFFDKQITKYILELSKELNIAVKQQVLNINERKRINDYYQKSNFKYELFDFDENLHTKINDIDIAITRSGASAIAELAHLNIPFLAIPFPFAKDNHQFYNAKVYEENNCCWLIKQNDLNSINFINLFKDKKDHEEKKNNLSKITNQNSWNNVNKKLIDLINEN